MKMSKQHIIEAKRSTAVYNRICHRSRMGQTYMALECSSSTHETLEFVWGKVRKLEASLVLIRLLTSGFLQRTGYQVCFDILE